MGQSKPVDFKAYDSKVVKRVVHLLGKDDESIAVFPTENLVYLVNPEETDPSGS